jgi:hypothetical protein
MKIVNFWIVLASLTSLLIFFLMGDFYLKFFFSLLFFLIMIFLGLFLFSDKAHSYSVSIRGISWFSAFRPSLFLYCLSFVFSLVVVLTGQPEITIVNSSSLATYLSLAPISVMKLVSGLFLLSVFPGYAVCKTFFKSESFAWFEKFGLAMAFSFCVNVVIGLLFVGLNLPLSSFGLIFSMWMFVLAVEVIGRFSKAEFVKKPITSASLIESILVVLVFLVLLLGVYSITLSSGPVSGLTGGDVTDYFVLSNRFVYLNFSDSYAWLKLYLLFGSSVTGFPVAFVYPALQYMILLVPISIYVLLKRLFPQREIAAIGALFVSLMQGLSTLPFLTNLISSPALSNDYFNNGAILQTMSNLIFSVDVANSNTYALWVSTIETGLFIFALLFLFKYISADKRSLNYLVFGVFLLAGAFYTHFLFLFLCLIGTIAVFSLMKRVSKRRLLELMGATALIMMPLEILTRMPLVNQILVFSLESQFSQTGAKAASVSLYGFAISAAIALYVVLLFRASITRKLGLSKYFNEALERLKKISRFSIKTSLVLFIFSFCLIVVSFLITYLNFGSISVNQESPSYVRPWFIWILYWGFEIPLVIGLLPLVFKRFDKTSLTLLISLLFSVLGLAILFYIMGPTSWATPSLLTKRYLFFMSFPLGCLAALGLATLVSFIKQADYTWNIRNATSRKSILNRFNFSLNKRKLVGVMLTIFLVTSMATSYLSYAFVDEYWFANSDSGAMPSSDANVLGWMRNNLSSDSTVMALSSGSYDRLCSILTSKVVPIFWNPDASVGDIWPRRIIMGSELPEAIFYGLNQLGVKYVYVGSEDGAFMSSSSSTFISLLETYPSAYSFGGVKLIQVPENYLFQDSNYHIVSGMWDFNSSSALQNESVEFQKTPNLFLSEMLLRSGVPYSIAPDSDLKTLEPSNVYVFPFNQRLPTTIQGNFPILLENGAHVIFADPSFGSSTEVGQTVTRTLKIFDVAGSVSNKIILNGSELLVNRNEAGIDIQTGNFTVPFMVREVVGKGSITFVNLSLLDRCSSTARDELLQLAGKELFSTLPTPVSPNHPLSLPIPEELFKAFTGGTIEVWQNRNLLNNLLLQDSTSLLGQVSMNSEYLYLNSSSFFVENMEIRTSNRSLIIENSMLDSLEILGRGSIKSNESEFLLYNCPGGYYTRVDAIGTEKSSSCNMDFTNAQIKLKLDSNEQVFSGANITIGTISASNLFLIVKQPAITVNGTLNGLLQGAFIHENTFFRAFSSTYASISGNFSLEILYSSGVTFAKLKVDSLRN